MVWQLGGCLAGASRYLLRSIKRVYTAVMGLARHRTNTGSEGRGSTTTRGPTLGPWGVYGEAIGNPKFYIGADPRDSEFLQADTEFASAHEDLLRELAKH
jgi:hypothetical protein